MEETKSPSEFIDMIKQIENAKESGFYTKTKLWKPHESAEPGRDTIRYEYKLQPGEIYPANNPQTTAHIERLLRKDLVEHAQDAEKTCYKHIRTTYDAKAQNSLNALDKQSQLLLVEKQFNHGNLVKWPKMMRHIYNKNLDGALSEARGK